jgi:hypothetical protein
MSINIYIESLVFNEIDIKAHHKTRLKAAVESELKQQFEHQWIDPGMRLPKNQHSVTGNSILLRNTYSPETLGQQIGNAIYRGIRK